MNSKVDIYFEELKTSTNLPSPSGVALDIIRLTQDPNHRFDDLLRPIQSDPTLTGRILKMANSAQHAHLPPVLSTQDALLRVGTSALTHLALSLSVLDNNRNGACLAFNYDSFWSTSLMRALGVQILSNTHSHLLKPAEAFSVGLLMEVGRLALAQIHPTRYAQCLLANLNDNLLELEQETFFITHQQISWQMMREWNIPEPVLVAVKMAHSMQDLTDVHDEVGYLAVQLRLASYLSGIDYLDKGARDLPLLMNKLSLTFTDLDQIRSNLFQEWRSWGELLFLPAPEIGQYLLDFNRSHQSTADQQPCKIMVVDDDRIERQILSSYLTDQGYKVVTATDGDNALSEFIIHRPEIVITDYLMQPVDGLSLTRALRSNQETEAAYIILITADKETDTMEMAFDAGVNDFIFKPVQKQELAARIIGANRFIERDQKQALDKDSIRQEAVDLALAKRRFAALAITDPLTGLYNRRYATSRLETEWSTFTRHGRSFGVVSLDLDKFKEINDNFGHDAGDKVLQHFASILQQSIRSEDIACRMGGEEFIVISPNTDLTTIKSLCERIRNRVEKQQPQDVISKRPITVSIGAAISDLAIDANFNDTIKRSDVALYEAKSTGRNKTIINYFPTH